jgi:hypothetical protein
MTNMKKMNQSMNCLDEASHRFDEDMLKKKLESLDQWFEHESALDVVSGAIDVVVDNDDVSFVSLAESDAGLLKQKQQKKKKTTPVHHDGDLESLFRRRPTLDTELDGQKGKDRKRSQVPEMNRNNFCLVPIEEEAFQFQKSKKGEPKIRRAATSSGRIEPDDRTKIEHGNGKQRSFSRRPSATSSSGRIESDDLTKSEHGNGKQRSFSRRPSVTSSSSGRIESDDLTKSEQGKGKQRSSSRKIVYRKQQQTPQRSGDPKNTAIESTKSEQGKSVEPSKRNKSPLNTRRKDPMNQSGHSGKSHHSKTSESKENKADSRGEPSKRNKSPLNTRRKDPMNQSGHSGKSHNSRTTETSESKENKADSRGSASRRESSVERSTPGRARPGRRGSVGAVVEPSGSSSRARPRSRSSGRASTRSRSSGRARPRSRSSGRARPRSRSSGRAKPLSSKAESGGSSRPSTTSTTERRSDVASNEASSSSSPSTTTSKSVNKTRPSSPQGDNARSSRKNLTRQNSSDSISSVPRSSRRLLKSTETVDVTASKTRGKSRSPSPVKPRSESRPATRRGSITSGASGEVRGDRRAKIKRMDSVQSFFGSASGHGAQVRNANKREGGKADGVRRESSANFDDLFHGLRRKTGQDIMKKSRKNSCLDLSCIDDDYMDD